jgi:DNA topoisomerase-1
VGAILSRRILVICEKPKVALRIAEALDDNSRPERYYDNDVPYYIVTHGNETLIVVAALGHLYTISQKGGKWTYPSFEYHWVPMHEVDKRTRRSKNFIEVIHKLSKDADDYVNACDFDIEGSLIGYMVLQKICGSHSLKKAERMRFSTLTTHNIKEAWERRAASLDFHLIDAGIARHEVDWLFGINLSRALTLSVKKATRRYKTLSIGRVQGPTLNFIKEKENAVRSFVPKSYWEINAEILFDGQKITLTYEKKRIDDIAEATSIVDSCRGKNGVITEIISREIITPPPFNFNLGDLQRAAYAEYKYSPRVTSQATERLYLNALISYPRTSSQKIPPSIDIPEILRGLSKYGRFNKHACQLLLKSSFKPRQGKKDDPAHPAIHPTGQVLTRLRKTDLNIFDLICKRFMTSLGTHAVRESTLVKADIEGHRYNITGIVTKEPGWMRLKNPYMKAEETTLPRFKVKQSFQPTSLNILKRFTKPPRRFSSSSLLKKMEDELIGTQATRVDIIETLHKRGYVKGDPIEITELGLAVVGALSRYNPEILSTEMTRILENDMVDIGKGEKTLDEMIKKTINFLDLTLSNIKTNEEDFGSEIGRALGYHTHKTMTLGSCPKCKTGEIKLIQNIKTGKRFAGCSSFYTTKCDIKYPLPQRGVIKTLGKQCNTCGSPVIKITRRKNQPWKLCLDPECPSKNGRAYF